MPEKLTQLKERLSFKGRRAGRASSSEGQPSFTNLDDEQKHAQQKHGASPPTSGTHGRPGRYGMTGADHEDDYGLSAGTAEQRQQQHSGRQAAHPGPGGRGYAAPQPGGHTDDYDLAAGDHRKQPQQEQLQYSGRHAANTYADSMQAQSRRAGGQQPPQRHYREEYADPQPVAGSPQLASYGAPDAEQEQELIQRPATKTARWAMTGDDGGSPTRSQPAPANVEEDEVEAFGDQPGSPSPRNGQRNQLGGLQPGTNRWDEGSAQPPPLLQQQTGPSRWDAGSSAQAGSNRMDAGSAKAQQGGASSRLQNMTTASRQHVDAPATGTRYDGGKTSWTPEPKAALQHHQASEEDSPVVVRAGSDLSDLSDPEEFQKYGDEDGGEGEEEGEDDIEGEERRRDEDNEEEEERLRDAAMAAVKAQYGGAVPSGGAGMPLAAAAAAAMAARQNAALSPTSVQAHHAAPSPWSAAQDEPAAGALRQQSKPQPLHVRRALEEQEGDSDSTDWSRPGPGHYDGDTEPSPALAARQEAGRAASGGLQSRGSSQLRGLQEERSSAGRSSASAAAAGVAAPRQAPKAPLDTPVDSPHPRADLVGDESSQWDSDSDGEHGAGTGDRSSGRPSNSTSQQQERLSSASRAWSSEQPARTRTASMPEPVPEEQQARSKPAPAYSRELESGASRSSSAALATTGHGLDGQPSMDAASEDRTSRGSVESGKVRSSATARHSGKATEGSGIPRYLQATAASGAKSGGGHAGEGEDVAAGPARKLPSGAAAGPVAARTSNGTAAPGRPAAAAPPAAKASALAKPGLAAGSTRIPTAAAGGTAPGTGAAAKAATKAEPVGSRLPSKPSATQSPLVKQAAPEKPAPTPPPPAAKPSGAKAAAVALSPALSESGAPDRESASSNATRAPSEAASSTAASRTSASAAFGVWKLVRLKKAMMCDASTGTVEQETVDGDKEVFQCDVVMQPGALAVVIAHDVALADDESQRGPRTWCFCPDSLCMDSKPKGSNLPAWPPKLPLEPGMKITRSEYNQLLELGLDVQAPAKKAAADGGK